MFPSLRVKLKKKKKMPCLFVLLTVTFLNTDSNID